MDHLRSNGGEETWSHHDLRVVPWNRKSGDVRVPLITWRPRLAAVVWGAFPDTRLYATIPPFFTGEGTVRWSRKLLVSFGFV